MEKTININADEAVAAVNELYGAIQRVQVALESLTVTVADEPAPTGVFNEEPNALRANNITGMTPGDRARFTLSADRIVGGITTAGKI